MEQGQEQQQERRSDTSVAARALVAAKQQADAIEAELARETDKRFASRRRRRELETQLREIRAVERRCLEALGGSPESATG